MFWLSILQISALAQEGGRVLDGVTLADPRVLYVPLREAAKALDMPIGLTPDGTIQVAGIKLAPKGVQFPSGTRLIPVRELTRWNAEVSWSEAAKSAVIVRKGNTLQVRRGTKRIYVDKSEQALALYQGDRKVMRTRISTGKEGKRTPNGDFKVGIKKRMHYSTLYENSPMPFSVQVVGDIFIHGYESVPNRPASHGCIRVPLNGQAEFLFMWAEPGTPVRIRGAWKS